MRRDTAANWTNSNPILGDGEFGFEKDSKKMKIGDGVTAWNSLAYYIADTNLDMGSIKESLVPDVAGGYDLGTAQQRWRNLYQTGSFISMGSVNLDVTDGRLTVGGDYIPKQTEVTQQINDAIIQVGSTLTNGNATLTLNADGRVTFPDGTHQVTAYTREYSNLINTPTIPTDVSDLTDTSGLLEHADLSGYATESYVANELADYVQSSQLTQTLDPYATELYVTTALFGYATENYVTLAANDIRLEIPANAAALTYVPSTSSDWASPAPTTVGAAIDRIAALLKTLNSGTGA